MKITIGLIFIFSVISVSLSSTLRELEFYQSLFPGEGPGEGIPKSLVTSMLIRRSNQTKTLSEKSWMSEDAKTFYNSTLQSLQLLLDSMDENVDTIIHYYRIIVAHLASADEHLKFHNFNDYVTVKSQYSLPREKLQALMDAYIDDIDLVSQLSSIREGQIDIETVDRLKSLSNDLRNLNIYREDANTLESRSIYRSAIDQYFLQLDFLLNEFTRSFTRN